MWRFCLKVLNPFIFIFNIARYLGYVQQYRYRDPEDWPPYYTKDDVKYF